MSPIEEPTPRQRMRLVSSQDWPQSEAAPTPAPPAPHHQPVVLIATRELQMRAFGTTVLTRAGFRVEAQTRGETIIADLETLRPDLILTDPSLDDMHAARLCAGVRERPTGSTVPVLVISEDPDSPNIQKILSEEFTDFISAPVNWKVLTFRIHRWISMAKKFRALSDHDPHDLEQVRDSALKASTELLQLRNYDSVTGLPNREMFLSTIELVLSQNQRAGGYSAVLYFDIDDFKGVNDLIGRSLGDELLRIVAKRLQGSLRDGDLVSQAGDGGSLTSFARLNGDQFAILLSSVQGREEAAAVAGRLLEALARPILIRERQFRLAARVGIADSSELAGDEEAGDEEETLVQRAETAMRYCKQHKGKTHAFFESFMNELVLKKLELKAELRQAIDGEQLFLCYQLLVDSHTSAPTGVEGLVRWQHPSRGMVPPNDFLPVAEESDLIIEIDRWVLRDGCRQAKQWIDDGYPPLLMSLNVSMRFLEQEDFAQQILGIVEETGIPPSVLQLELSERGTLPDAGRIMAQFDLLVSRGIQLALDDFGTGQTSLSYLRTLPITCVKVDQSFVRRIPDDSASVAIVTAIVAMSHHLGLKVVAEGVETANHWRFLAEKEYDQLQGYLFSRPEPVEALEQTFRRLGGQRAREEPAAGHGWLRVLPAAAAHEAADAPESPAEETPWPPVEAIPALPVPPASAADETAAQEMSRPARKLTETSPIRVPEGATAPDDADQWGQTEANLLQLAHKDFLTGLYNRFSFDERLEHAVAHADRFNHRVALLLLDLDDFKYVNDTHGHEVGDALLIQISRRLKSLVRKVDTLARIGGDEFAVVLSEFRDLRDVAEFARRLLSVLAQPVDVEGRELRVTGSLGVAVYPEGKAQTKDLLRQADLALYKAKNQGGNGVRFFAREMDREVQQRLALGHDLAGATERGELFIEYQLQVALATGEIVGAEALLRWDHPSRGVIDPGRFIPIAESTGEIRPIGRWVIRSACAQARQWQESTGREVPVSVNLSPVQCRDRQFVETILEALKEHRLAPRMLDLELNEKLLERLPQELEDRFRQLGEFGISLTLDNFGTGASALEHFQRFRFDRMKIHQSLVRTIGQSQSSPSVLSGIVALARKMDVQILAEGIEESEEVEALLAEGCEVGQGFLFSKPMSASALGELIGRSPILPGFESPAAPAAAQATPAADGNAVEKRLPSIVEAGGELLPSIEDWTSTGAMKLPDIAEAAPAPAEPAPAEIEPEPAPAASEPVSEPEPAQPEPAPALAQPEPAPAEAVVAAPSAESAKAGAPAAAAPAVTAPAAIADAPLRPPEPSVRRVIPPPPPVKRAPPWRLHALLAAAALAIWGFALWPWQILDRLPAVPAEPPAAESPVAGPPAAVEQQGGEAAGAESVAAVDAPAPLPPAAPEGGPPEPDAPAAELVDFVKAWARAWSEKRVDDYLELYAADFQPPKNQSRDKWEQERRDRMSQPGDIEVKASGFEAETLGADRVRLSFDQSYRSPRYSDVVRKTLELVREDGGWKIVAEGSAG